MDVAAGPLAGGRRRGGWGDVDVDIDVDVGVSVQFGRVSGLRVNWVVVGCS